MTGPNYFPFSYPITLVVQIKINQRYSPHLKGIFPISYFLQFAMLITYFPLPICIAARGRLFCRTAGLIFTHNLLSPFI